MPKCTTCGNKFTEKSRREYKQAPAWNQECPICTKQKFGKYFTDYLAKLFDDDDITEMAELYFGRAIPRLEDRFREELYKEIIDLILKKLPGSGKKRPATIGQSINQFVTFIDKHAADKRFKSRSKNKGRVTTLAIGALAVGIALIAVSIVFTFFF